MRGRRTRAESRSSVQAMSEVSLHDETPAR